MSDGLDQLEIDDGTAHSRRDAGFSLTEVIVAVLLMSIAVVPIMLAAGVSVRSSTQSRTLARVETVLANAADRVNRAPEGCDYKIYVEAAALAEGWQVSQATVSYQYYTPAASAATAGTWQAGACPGGVRPDGLVQMVTIGIQSTDGRTLRTIQVVKSDV
jgi:prepilin-type N-terminal cleavage/methylation domain-containing protein